MSESEVFAFEVTVRVEAATRKAAAVLSTVQGVLDDHTHTIQEADVLGFKEAVVKNVVRLGHVPPRAWVVKRDACYLDAAGANTFERWRAIRFDNARRAKNWAKRWPGVRVVRVVPKAPSTGPLAEKSVSKGGG
jgi:hypothetical protein